jgi:hypothetical protein
MIQNAMRQIHFSISINKTAKSQALEVIRKLKEVMPIARASMLLRVFYPSKAQHDIKRLLEEELSLAVLKESEANDASSSNAMMNCEVRIDPEIYRKLEESVQALTNGSGRIDVLIFRDSVPAQTNPNAAKAPAASAITSNTNAPALKKDHPQDVKSKNKAGKKKKKASHADKEDDTVSAKSRAPLYRILEDDNDDEDSGSEEEGNEKKAADLDAHVEKPSPPDKDLCVNPQDADSDHDNDEDSDDDVDEDSSEDEESALGIVLSKVTSHLSP